ncbi:hypothetical protein FisN_9Lu361 [Fistulifera solaris]|uniref:Protein SirB1 N-terminal domain-containing protein n=1 Tax=Fistulifera solaris TaxID=1519565 RepID=A0A1Z5KLU5_FISSO|nr:hypothetical protein FisN_9Lu361 [Fistulifera solaris]|eukprot:GAX27042.1 hypothetical protein FisN_9Lu361 [Fistulifera solaris]
MVEDCRVDDFMMHVALQRKQAYSVMLALVYLCVAQRLDLKLDIVALPGLVLVGVRTAKCFIDVENGGRVLQKRDLVSICNYRGVPFMEHFVTSVPSHETFDLICTGMMQGIGNADEAGEEFKETTLLRMLMRTNLKMMVHEPYESDKILKHCLETLSRRWILIMKSLHCHQRVKRICFL